MFGIRLFKKSFSLYRPTIRHFRMIKKNPLVEPEIKITLREAEEQQDLPVWERMFDHKKYMEHEGPLKMSTGLSMLDVEPFPRAKLMKLYFMTIHELRDIPDTFKYKLIIEELIKFRMEIVDQNKRIRDIEEKIAKGMVEELIFQAHSEIKLLKFLKK